MLLASSGDHVPDVSRGGGMQRLPGAPAGPQQLHRDRRLCRRAWLHGAGAEGAAVHPEAFLRGDQKRGVPDAVLLPGHLPPQAGPAEHKVRIGGVPGGDSLGQSRAGVAPVQAGVLVVRRAPDQPGPLLPGAAAEVLPHPAQAAAVPADTGRTAQASQTARGGWRLATQALLPAGGVLCRGVPAAVAQQL